MSAQITFTSVRFTNFKALKRYSLQIGGMNVLVGPNNSGKSTILGAFAALSTGIRKALSKKAENYQLDGGWLPASALEESSLPISIENAHSDFNELPSDINFRVSNGFSLRLHFPSDGGCFLIPVANGRRVDSPSSFRKYFPTSIAVVPVLGPVEHEEIFLTDKTVKSGLFTHRFSRHFRNYWWHNPKGFNDFAAMIKETWPGMDISPPEQPDFPDRKLTMFCRENRMTRELYWVGFGFQIWCQLLTLISLSKKASMIVVDEPEIYLHPSVQRRLVNILRDSGPDILLATHSAEIMGEADATEIVLIDKRKQSGRRLRDVKDVQAALQNIGSIQNITLTQIAQNRHILFVEGNTDFRMLKRFARILGLTELSNGFGITMQESGGSSQWKEIKNTASAMNRFLDRDLKLAIILDRDYCCDEEILEIKRELKRNLQLVHIHQRKEIENYLLIPTVLERSIIRAIKNMNRKKGSKTEFSSDIREMLEAISATLHEDTLAQYISKRTEYFKKDRRSSATITREALAIFKSKWACLETRMEVVPGKVMLHRFREMIQDAYGASLSDFSLIDSFRPEDIPPDLEQFLYKLEDFRKTK